MSITTRFAPSPTGFLHIGGARTALFNFLLARHHGGRFLLRIEDTDKARSTEAAKAAIIEGLRWLGLDWDGATVFQSEGQQRHADVARDLLSRGLAYNCYCTPEELAEMREQARAENRSIRYDGRWRDRDPADAPPGVDPVVRLKVPQDGTVVLNDAVQGTVEVTASELDDFVLLRSDGTPTYMLSVVVDDHDMGVTHVVRGDDHLTNAFRQTALFQACGWDLPVFGHVPLIHGPDGAKLSKRHGALGVEAYRDMGYLPEAMCNYLLRLGWSHGDTEIVSRDEAIALFDLDGIGRAPARLDFAKMDSVNAHYIKLADDARLADLICGFLEADLGRELDDADRARLLAAMPELKQRPKTLVELADNARFLVAHRPLTLTDKARKALGEDGAAVLKSVGETLAGMTVWDEEAAERAVSDFADQAGLKMRAVAQPLRAALTGSHASPGIFQVLAYLGRDESLGRIDDVVGGRVA